MGDGVQLKKAQKFVKKCLFFATSYYNVKCGGVKNEILFYWRIF